jgi:hypothetical protein
MAGASGAMPYFWYWPSRQYRRYPPQSVQRRPQFPGRDTGINPIIPSQTDPKACTRDRECVIQKLTELVQTADVIALGSGPQVLINRMIHADRKLGQTGCVGPPFPYVRLWRLQ